MTDVADARVMVVSTINVLPGLSWRELGLPCLDQLRGPDNRVPHAAETLTGRRPNA